MGTLDTKLLIANALTELCESEPLKKVSISDIIERTGKNRKTFYYHFEDKNALIVWKFRYDLAAELQRRFPENILVYEKAGTGTLDRFPFYITQKSGVRSLDHSTFFSAFAHVLEQNRTFYTQAFQESGPSSLRNYLFDLYLPALRNDIILILANRYLPEENIDFLSEFYTCAFLSYFIHKCEKPGNVRLAGMAGPFANIIHSSLESEIKEAQLRRNL